MKRLFKLGLVALMGVCGLVGISRAQTAVYIDTALSQEKNCTLQDDGSWKMGEERGLKLKVTPVQSDTTLYKVTYACKQGNEVKKTDDVLVRQRAGWSASQFGTELANVASGTYTLELTKLLTRPNTDAEWEEVTGATFPPTLTIVIAEPAFTLTATPAAVDTVEDVDNEGETIERWVFPTQTAPKFTVAMENAEMQGAMIMAYEGIPTNGNAATPIFQTMVYEEPFEFTFKPMAEEEGGDDVDLQAEVAEYFPDGDYMIAVSDMDEVYSYFYLRIGLPTIWKLTAVDAAEVGPLTEPWMEFPTGEATFSMSVENGPDTWMAVIHVATQEQNAIILESDTIRSADEIKTVTFSTLTGGVHYVAECTVYGADDDVLWTNFDPEAGKYGMEFVVNGEVLPTDPTLTVTAGGTNTMNNDTIVFSGMGILNLATTGELAEDDSLGNYTISIDIYKRADWFNDDPFFFAEPVLPMTPFEAADTVAGVVAAQLVDAYNGEYVALCYLNRKYNSLMLGEGEEPLEGTEAIIYFNVTNYEAPAELEISAKAVGATVENEKITFGKDNIAFDIFVKNRAAGDTSKIDVYIWTAEEAENAAGADAIRINAADSVRFAAEGIYYDGEYVAKFDLRTYNARRGEEISADVFEIPFFVTGNPVPEIPGMTVKAVGNTVVEDTVVFADGNVAFDMFVKDLTAKDTNIELRVSVWNTADEADYPLSQIFKAADSVRFEGLYYNGKYAATFEIGYINGREFIPDNDTTIIFLVTENEEPVEDYTVTIKAVGATMTADTAAYTGKVAFDIFVTGLKADDDMSLVTTIYNKAQYEAEPQPGEDVALDTIAISKVKAADSVRFENAEIVKGEYVAVVELVRAGSREDIPAEFAVLYFTVSEGSAVENAELAGVNVYPNPNNGTFNVAVPEKARIDIFGLNGAKVMSREANAGVETFSINHSGIYFVRVMAGNKAAVKRVVVR